MFWLRSAHGSVARPKLSSIQYSIVLVYYTLHTLMYCMQVGTGLKNKKKFRCDTHNILCHALRLLNKRRRFDLKVMICLWPTSLTGKLTHSPVSMGFMYIYGWIAYRRRSAEQADLENCIRLNNNRGEWRDTTILEKENTIFSTRVGTFFASFC
jgi:hypothetical protein